MGKLTRPFGLCWGFGPTLGVATQSRRQVGWRWALVVYVLAPIACLQTSVCAQLRIQEIVAVNGSSLVDENESSSDWIELYNPGLEPLSVGGYYLSDDPTNLRKWQVPDLVVEPEGYLIVWCSGEDRIYASAESVLAGLASMTPNVISADGTWSYLPGELEPEDPTLPAGWTDLDFDDSQWQRGIPPFGFDDEFELNSPVPDGTQVVLLRHRFHLHDPDALPDLLMRVHLDDGMVVYLNGVRIINDGFQAHLEPSFTSNSRRSQDASRPKQLDFGAFLPLARPGENILAVALLNRSRTSNDLSFTLELGTPELVAHTNFSLAGEGEPLILSDPTGRPIDFLELPGPQLRDRSFGRPGTTAGDFLYLLSPTPLAPNNTFASADPIPIEPKIEPVSGEYDAPVEVSISTDGFSLFPLELRYSLDGTDPTVSSPIYTRPFVVESGHVVRARVFFQGEPISRISTRTYFMDVAEYDLPILALGMEPRAYAFVHNTADGRGRLSERAGHIELFGEDGRLMVGTDMGLRLHGGAGRGGGLDTKKSYRAYFRRFYGEARLNFSVITDIALAEFDKLVLRGNFNDAFRTNASASYIRDQVIRDVHGEMGAVISHGTWYNLFVNMQFRGIYNVVERLDRNFFESYFPAEGNDWYVVKTNDEVLDGGFSASRAWDEFQQFFADADLREPTNYEQAHRLIDVANYTSYMILNIWAENQDWPHNNWYAARPARPGGRWIFLSWDAEWGMGLVPAGSRMLSFIIDERANTSIGRPLARLMVNRDYQRFFVEELDRYLDGPLRYENVLAHIDKAATAVARDIEQEATLPGAAGDFSVEEWERNVEEVADFARRRAVQLRTVILEEPYFFFPRVSHATPQEVVAPESEVAITLRGRSFTKGTQVFFNGLSSPSVEWQSGSRLVAMLPFDLRVEGDTEIYVVDEDGDGLRTRGALNVLFARPAPSVIIPEFGFDSGGDQIVIIGSGFIDGVQVEFSGVPSPLVQVLDSETLSVVTPAGSGEADVLVINTKPGPLPAPTTLRFRFEQGNPGFQRGDANNDGKVNLTDAIATLHFLFAGAAPLCEDALDVDDSGAVGFSDAIFLLEFLFTPSAPAPAEPFATCGDDPTADLISCGQRRNCVN